MAFSPQGSRGSGSFPTGGGVSNLSQLDIDVSKNWAGKLIKNLGNPVVETDATNLRSVRTEINGFYWKSPIDKIDTSEFPTDVIGSTYADFNGVIWRFDGNVWVELYAAREGNALYNKSDKEVYVWNGGEWYKFSGSGSGSTPNIANFTDLGDVLSVNPQVDDIYVVASGGMLVNKSVWELPLDIRYLTVPTVEPSRMNHILFSDGGNGSFTNGIKTNEYKQLDLNFNRIKNAVIDCGTYYG